MLNADKLLNYYDENIERISEILKIPKEDIPRNVALFLEPGEDCSYNREERRIIYRFKNEGDLLVDRGRLIHEAAHVVQNYPFKIHQQHPCWCWMEGIADYCRVILDPDFNLENDLTHEPEKGYKEAAHFLNWLSKEYTSLISDLNLLIRDKAEVLNNHNQIFDILLQKNFSQLKREYIYSMINKQT